MFLKTQKFQLPVKCVHVNMFKRPLPPGFDPVTKRKRKSSPGGKFFRLLDRLGKKKALQYIKDGSFDQVPRRLKEKKKLNQKTYQLLFDDKKGLVSLEGERLIVRPSNQRSICIDCLH